MSDIKAAMLLVIADSFVTHLPRDLSRCDRVRTAGTCVCLDRFQHWVVRVARISRPQTVLIIAGGNDLARPDFQIRNLMHAFSRLVSGLPAAEFEWVALFPIPPRDRTRCHDVTVQDHYRRCRVIHEKILRETSRECITANRKT